MKNKKSLLNSIDLYFADKTESQTKSYLFFAVIVVGAIVYFLTTDPATDFLVEQETGLERITEKLDKTDAYLMDPKISGPTRKDLNYGINQYTRILKQKEKEHEDTLKANEYVEKKLQDVSSVTYNEKNWAKFLDDLTTLAKSYNIKLYSVNSWTRPLKVGQVQEVLNVNLNAEGGFNSLLAYINSIEESKMVVDVNGIDLNHTGKAVAGDINVSLWGVKYGGIDINVEQANKNLADKNVKKGGK